MPNIHRSVGTICLENILHTGYSSYRQQVHRIRNGMFTSCQCSKIRRDCEASSSIALVAPDIKRPDKSECGCSNSGKHERDDHKTNNPWSGPTQNALDGVLSFLCIFISFTDIFLNPLTPGFFLLNIRSLYPVVLVTVVEEQLDRELVYALWNYTNLGLRDILQRVISLAFLHTFEEGCKRIFILRWEFNPNIRISSLVTLNQPCSRQAVSNF
jgi:hypothetical protein